MDIGTGKDHPKKAKVHLIDLVSPDERFTAADYFKKAKTVIKEVWGREKLPIIVGGTGFYIKALVDGIETMGIKPDWNLRKELEGLGIVELGKKLKGLVPERWENMNRSDRLNPRRLIRAIEVAQEKTKGVVVRETDKKNKGNRNQGVKADSLLMIGLRASFPFLYSRIDKRVKVRVGEGLEGEIRGLLAAGFSWENSVLGSTLAYQEWEDYFKGEVSKKEVVEKWRFAEHAYARRQMTWFKKDKRIIWFDISQSGFEDLVVRKVVEWYSRNDAEN